MAEAASARATALQIWAYTPPSPLPLSTMAEIASARATASQIPSAASAREFSRELHISKMAAPMQGGSGSPREVGSGGRPSGAAPVPGAAGEQASNPAYMAARRRLKVRNALTALAIGAFVLGIYSYTFLSIRQESFLEELELEAKAVQARAPKTSAN